MDFILYCLDKPGRAEARRKTRPDHLEYIAQRQHMFRYGGPLIDEEGRVKGSLMIISAKDRAELERHMEGDPFFGADLPEHHPRARARQLFCDRLADPAL